MSATTQRRALSMRWPVLLPLAVAAHQFARVLRDAHDIATGRVRFASQTQAQPLLHHVKKHQSRLLRQVVDDDRWLQHGKVQNLRVAAPLLDGAVLRPGETLSFWQRVGPPLKSRGFTHGTELRRGVAQPGIGGGLCQAANVIHWLALHSPLTVVQRSTHSVDPFPDHERSIPWGTGCAVFFNHLDLRVRNDTTTTFQLRLRVTERFLEGELRSDVEPDHGWSVFERAARFEQVDGAWWRENELWRRRYRRDTGVTIDEELVKQNRARVLYVPATSSVSAHQALE